MRFSCGETQEAKEKRLQAEYAHLSKWHPRFAWLPKSVGIEDGRKICVWLGWCEAMVNVWVGPVSGRVYFDWTYRLPGEQ